MDRVDVDLIHAKIQHLKKDAEQLRQLGEGFAAVRKNADRMLACIKMLELNVSDLYTLGIFSDQKRPRRDF
jgi:hypothetical protein